MSEARSQPDSAESSQLRTNCLSKLGCGRPGCHSSAGQKICAERGLILVDTKYEFGKTKDGRIIVIDEIHTPDSSRFWMRDTYEARFAAGQDPEPLDKDFVRRAFIAMGYRGDGPPPAMPDDVRVGAAQRYIEAYERITGTTFSPNLDAPLPRIEKNLKARTASA